MSSIKVSMWCSFWSVWWLLWSAGHELEPCGALTTKKRNFGTAALARDPLGT